MKLYGNSPSPFVRHCHIALLESGLEFEFIHADSSSSTLLSPLQKIPYLEYEENGKTRMLTDSSSILRYIRELSGKVYLPTVAELNDFCAINTLIDAQVNLFLLKKEGLTPESVNYLKRQQSRIQTGLRELEKGHYAAQAPWTDVELRLGCFLDWNRFRKHFGTEEFPNLNKLLESLDKYPYFKQTSPFDA